MDRIVNWPTPKMTKQLQSWLGFVNYYHSFIQNFSVLTAEMNVQSREKMLKWTEVMEEKFKELKEKFKKFPIRAYPRYGEDEAPFEIWPDFSNQAIGPFFATETGWQAEVNSGRRKENHTRRN